MSLKDFFVRPSKAFEWAACLSITAGVFLWFGSGPALVVLGICIAGESIDMKESGL